MSKIIVITGASAGFGALTARALADAGHTVYAGMRDTAGRNATAVADAAGYAAEHGVDLRTVELDVADQDSVDAAIAQISRGAGRIDVVVHNAGHMVLGPAEAFTPEQLAASTTPTCCPPSGSTAPRCRTCGSRAVACCCGSGARARLAQGSKAGADVFGQQLRLLHGREMAAPRHLRPAPDVEESLGPLPRRRDYVLGEDGEAGWHPYPRALSSHRRRVVRPS